MQRRFTKNKNMYTKDKALDLLGEVLSKFTCADEADLDLKSRISAFIKDAMKETPFSRLQATRYVPDWIHEDFADHTLDIWNTNEVMAIKMMKDIAKEHNAKWSIVDARVFIEDYKKIKEEYVTGK
jgi:hypothetical protein